MPPSQLHLLLKASRAWSIAHEPPTQAYELALSVQGDCANRLQSYMAYRYCSISTGDRSHPTRDSADPSFPVLLQISPHPPADFLSAVVLLR